MVFTKNKSRKGENLLLYICYQLSAYIKSNKTHNSLKFLTIFTNKLGKLCDTTHKNYLSNEPTKSTISYHRKKTQKFLNIYVYILYIIYTHTANVF